MPEGRVIHFLRAYRRQREGEREREREREIEREREREKGRRQTRGKEMLRLPPIKAVEDVFSLTPSSSGGGSSRAIRQRFSPAGGMDGPWWLIKKRPTVVVNINPGAKETGRNSRKAEYNTTLCKKQKCLCVCVCMCV